MPNIVIKEIDETVASLEGSQTDVVYVPGFARTNTNVYVVEKSGVVPTTTLQGTVPGVDEDYNTPLTSLKLYPSFVCNIVDKKVWKCTAEATANYTWTLQSNYVAPTPENVPTLCQTIKEFEDAFGKLPYKWEANIVNGAVESESDVRTRAKFPTFATNAFSTTDNYAYNIGDYEKSYIYARELITAGLPVIYDNIVERTSGDFSLKKPPEVAYLYSHLSEQFSELTDSGEYTVKYITSGAYPTFEYTGTYEVTYTDVGNFPFTGTNNQTVDVVTPSCRGNLPDGTPIGGPDTLVVTASYTVSGSSEVLTSSITVNAGTTYTEDNTKQWGGTGNTISITASGFAVHFAANDAPSWNWQSARYTATAIATLQSDVVNPMLSVASTRGDCVAIIDHTNNPVRKLTGSESVFESVNNYNFSNGEFGAMFTPWASYTVVNEGADVPSVQLLPASFAFLISLARSIRTNANWLAIAGVSRGLVPYIQTLNTAYRLSNTIANAYQPRDAVAINAITNIKPYGLTIWGNRTLKRNANNITATSLLNIRNLVSEVKKVAYTTAKSLMFEQNTEILWSNFKAGIAPLLDQMMTGQGLTGYKIIRGVTTERAKVVAEIRLYPIDAVEDFEITVTISDENVSVA